MTLEGVPVLMYHAVVDSQALPGLPAERRYAITAAAFSDHLALIRETSMGLVSLAELWSRSDGTTTPSSVVVTFDDGRASDFEIAYPRLRDAGGRAEFFVNTATIGTPGFLTWTAITEMQHGGMSFQSHSHDHVALSLLSRARLALQLRDSKRILEDRLGRPVDFLAVPYGLVNRTVVTVAREEGYRAVCTSRPWPARPGAATVNRVAIDGATTTRDLRGLIGGRLGSYAPRRARSLLISAPRRLVLRFRPQTLGVRVMERPA